MKLSDYFLGRTPEHQYDLMAAIRGPDSLYEKVCKNLVTERVRVIVWDSFLRLQDPLAPLNIEEIRRERLLAPTHFRSHLVYAVQASWGHEVWEEKESELCKALRGEL